MDVLWTFNVFCGHFVDDLWTNCGQVVDGLWTICGRIVDDLWTPYKTMKTIL